MKKRSSVQIIIDQNQNIRINNLSLDEFIETFDDYLEENKNNTYLVKSSQNQINMLGLANDIEMVSTYYESCEICFRKCNVNRNNNELGWCKLNCDTNVYMAAIINEEESLISPTYAIYLSSCNIDCLYCHQKQLMKPETKSYIATEYIINDVLINLSRIKTISFVGGNPELSFLTILRIIKLLVKANIDLPLVFNSTFLFAEKLYSLVDQYFNILIPDFKFWDGKCSKNLCGISSYRDIVQNNISYFLNKKEIIIRHLPLPGHWDCCSKPIIDWIASKVGEKDLCSLAVLDLLQADNSKSVNKCKSYAKKLKLKLN